MQRGKSSPQIKSEKKHTRQMFSSAPIQSVCADKLTDVTVCECSKRLSNKRFILKASIMTFMGLSFLLRSDIYNNNNHL